MENSTRILAVDDEPSNLILLERILNPIYEVVCVNSGQDALSKIAQESFDLVLLDIMMPGMTGYDVLDILRGHEQSADLPVILISALSDGDDIARGLQLGANDYVTKPIDFDITLARVQTQVELKQLNDQRKQMITSLEEANEMKNRLMRMASHDLKNPLHNINLAHTMLQDMLSPEAVEILNIASESAEMMQQLIEEFLETLALQDQAMNLNIEPIELYSLTQRIIDRYVLMAEKKDIRIYLDPFAYDVYADENRLMQVLNNLISNAIKYSPIGGNVWVTCECDGDTLRLTIIDQGSGIHEDERHKLFQPFGKLSSKPTDGESSTGLGLWIVKHLIDLQGGEVGVDCPHTGGSQFWFTLPLVSREMIIAG